MEHVVAHWTTVLFELLIEAASLLAMATSLAIDTLTTHSRIQKCARAAYGV